MPGDVPQTVVVDQVRVIDEQHRAESPSAGCQGVLTGTPAARYVAASSCNNAVLP